jgi:hypothetical protein
MPRDTEFPFSTLASPIGIDVCLRGRPTEVRGGSSGGVPAAGSGESERP